MLIKNTYLFPLHMFSKLVSLNLKITMLRARTVRKLEIHRFYKLNEQYCRRWRKHVFRQLKTGPRSTNTKSHINVFKLSTNTNWSKLVSATYEDTTQIQIKDLFINNFLHLLQLQLVHLSNIQQISNVLLKFIFLLPSGHPSASPPLP